jgi:hypothetical protein
METLIKNIGEICIKSLRDAILDFGLTDSDTIVLHTLNFDDIVIEHRETYRESIKIPFVLLGVEIREDKEKRAFRNKILIIKNDDAPKNYRATSTEEYPPVETFYRCGWCGNVVDFDGASLSSERRSEKIRLLEKFGSSINVRAVTGNCCKNRG